MKNKNLRISGIFRVLSSVVRIRIIRLLEREKTVSDIAEVLNRPSQSISQHLRILRVRGIVGYKRRGNRHLYFLRKRKILRVVRIVENLFTRK